MSTIIIQQSEYDELSRKAKLYDALQTKEVVAEADLLAAVTTTIDSVYKKEYANVSKD